MTRLPLIGLLALTACQNCRTLPPATGRAIYVGMGQSLMVGFFNNLMNEPGDGRLMMFKDGRWQIAVEPTSSLTSAATSPLVAFGKEMLRLNPSTPIGVINCAVGSTTLDEWMPGSAANPNLPVTGLFEACQREVTDALRAEPGSFVAGVVYNEGQSLAHECDGHWASLFPSFVQAVHWTWGEVPVGFAQLGNFTDAANCGAGFVEQFQDRQASVHAPKTFMIVTKDIPTTDGVHFTTEGQLTQGQRFAQAMTTTQGMKECSEPWWSRMLRI